MPKPTSLKPNHAMRAVLLACLCVSACAQDNRPPLQQAKERVAECPPNRRGSAVARDACVAEIENEAILPTARYPDLLRRQQTERAAVARQIDAGKITPERGQVLIRRQEAAIAQQMRDRTRKATPHQAPAATPEAP